MWRVGQTPLFLNGGVACETMGLARLMVSVMLSAGNLSMATSKSAVFRKEIMTSIYDVRCTISIVKFHEPGPTSK